MNIHSGRRAAIIDEIERRLNQIKRCNGYNLDIALVQKRFPALKELTYTEDTDSDTTETDYYDTTDLETKVEGSNFIDEQTLPALLLQYGNAGNSIERMETVGPAAQLDGSSRFTNLNELEERLVIVIRGIIRESASKCLIDEALLSPEPFKNLVYPIVETKFYSSVPKVGQLHLVFRNLTTETENNTILCTIAGEDESREPVCEETLSVYPLGKSIYINPGDTTDVVNKVKQRTGTTWTDNKEVFCWDLKSNQFTLNPDRTDRWQLTPLSGDNVYETMISCLSDRIHVTLPFQEGNAVSIYYQMKDCYPSLPETDDDLTNTTSTNNWKPVPANNKLPTSSDDDLDYYLLPVIKKETGASDNSHLVNANVCPIIKAKGNSDETGLVEALVIYSRVPKKIDILCPTLKGDSYTSKDLPDSWFLNTSEIPQTQNNKNLYAVSVQVYSDDTIEYGQPFRVVATAKEGNKLKLCPDTTIPIVRADTKKYFSKVNNVEIINTNSYNDKYSPTLTISSLPIQLTTLVSMLHSDLNQALYDKEGELEVKDAAGLIKEFYERNESTIPLTEFRTRVNNLLQNREIARAPVTLTLGIDGVQDYTITDWYTMEGIASPFEVIDFRLVIWHTYPKGSYI